MEISMTLFNGTGSTLVQELITNSNPDLTIPITSNDFIYGLPQAIVPDSFGRDTAIRVTAKNSSLYASSQLFKYRRIDLTSLTRNIVIIIEKYIVNRLMTASEFLPLVNSKYGLNLTVDDVSMPSFNPGANVPMGTITPKTITALPTSLIYTGSLTVNWKQSIQEIGVDLLTVTDLNGETWPLGNDFVTTPDRSQYGQWLFWDQHFTQDAATIGRTFGGTNNSWIGTIPNGNGWYTYVSSLLAPYSYLTGKAAKTTIVTLPSTDYPELNRPGFNKVGLIKFTDTTIGNIPLYYNV